MSCYIMHKDRSACISIEKEDTLGFLFSRGKMENGGSIMCESQGTALKNVWQSQEAKNTEVVLKKNGSVYT